MSKAISDRSLYIIVAIIIVATLANWFMLDRSAASIPEGMGYVYDETLPPNSLTIEQLQKKHKNDSLLLEGWQIAKETWQDSIMKLKVENGWLSVELNRKEAQLNQSIKQYIDYKESKKVDSALSVCDSIVYTYIPDYITAVDTAYSGLTKESEATSRFSADKDTLILYGIKTVDTLNASIKTIDNNQKITKKLERKRLISWGVIGAAIGALIATIFQK